jgi:hypothetical protein
MSKRRAQEARRVEPAKQQPTANLEAKLAAAVLLPQDFICRSDFYLEVRERERAGDKLDISETIAKYRALDDKPGAIANDRLARQRALQREHVEVTTGPETDALYDE